MHEFWVSFNWSNFLFILGMLGNLWLVARHCDFNFFGAFLYPFGYSNYTHIRCFCIPGYLYIPINVLNSILECNLFAGRVWSVWVLLLRFARWDQSRLRIIILHCWGKILLSVPPNAAWILRFSGLGENRCYSRSCMSPGCYSL